MHNAKNFVVPAYHRGNDSRIHGHNAARRKRNAFPITDTELRLIAALAIIGLSKMPNHGYRMPAATGTPTKL